MPPALSPELPSPLIELRNVTQRFGSQTVLSHVTLQIYPGETLALIGESGCGKSVTLKLMMGLFAPTEGEVLWNGTSLSDRTERQIVEERLRFGYLFQQAALFDSLNVYENVAFGLRQNARMTESEIRHIVGRRLREVGLPLQAAEKMPAELSGGMRKRVGLARALAMMPEVMFYDEPTTGLDPIMSDVINELILRTRQRRPVTSVVVTHDMNTVHKVADRVLMLIPASRLSDGREQIIFEGSAAEAFASRDRTVKQFVTGDARERLVEMELRDGSRGTTEEAANSDLDEDDERFEDSLARRLDAVRHARPVVAAATIQTSLAGRPPS